MFITIIRTYFLLHFLGLLYSVQGLVRLTYPPARKYAFDSLNNVTSEGPCGVPKGLGPITILPAGSTFNVTWHLGRVNEGSFYIELRNSDDKLVTKLSSEGFLDTQDPTVSSYPVTLPKKECYNCYIRLIREALDISRKSSENIIYWSCADVNIVNPKQINSTTKCSYHGEFQNNECGCEKLYSGQFCENKDECRTDEDCGSNGKCYSVETKLYPRMQCYCRSGWFGENCMQESSVKSLPVKFEEYHHQSLSDNYNMFWKILPDIGEIEIILHVTIPGYIGIGWHSKDQNNSCLEFPQYIIPNEFTTRSSLSKFKKTESSKSNVNSQNQDDYNNEENVRQKRANDDYESNNPTDDSPGDDQNYDYEDRSGITDTSTLSSSTAPITETITEIRALKTRRPSHVSTKMVVTSTTQTPTKISTTKTIAKKLTSPASTMNFHTTEKKLNLALDFTDYHANVSIMSSPQVKQTVSPAHGHPITTPINIKTKFNDEIKKKTLNMSDIDRLNQDMKDITTVKDMSENSNHKYTTMLPNSKTKLNANNRYEKTIKNNKDNSGNLDYNNQTLDVNNKTESNEAGDSLNQDIPANINNTIKGEINAEDDSNQNITNNQKGLNVNDIINTPNRNTIKNETADDKKLSPNNSETNEDKNEQASENAADNKEANVSNNITETTTKWDLYEEKDNKRQFVENSTELEHQMDYPDYPEKVSTMSTPSVTDIGKTTNTMKTKLNKGHNDSMRTDYNETNKNSTDKEKTKTIRHENSSKTDLITNFTLSGPKNTRAEQKNTSEIFNSSINNNNSTAWNTNSMNNFWNSSTITSIIQDSGIDKYDDRNLKSTNINYNPSSSTIVTNPPLMSDLSTYRIPRKNESPINVIINRDFPTEPKSETGDNGQLRENVLVPFNLERDLKHEIRGSMYCSDMVIASVKNGNYIRINDYYSRDHSTPMLDIVLGGTNGLTAALTHQDNEVTTILFRRKLKATEPTDQSFVKEPMEIIWALGQENGHILFGKPNDSEYYKTGILLYHGQNSSHRGVVTVNIFEILNYTSSNVSDNSVVDKSLDERNDTTSLPLSDLIFVSVCLANKTWKEDLQNPQSSYFQEVQYQVENAMTELLRNIPEVKEVHITQFREGSVLADLDVVLKTTDNINTTVKKVNDTLHNAIALGLIGDMGVDDTYLRVEYPASGALLGTNDNGFSFWQIHIYAIIGCICGLALIAIILANCKLYREKRRNKLRQRHHGRLIATPLWKEYPFSGNNNPVFEDFDADPTKYDKRTIYSDHDMTLTRKEKRPPVPLPKSNGEMKTSFDDGRKSANGSVVVSGNNWLTPVNRYYEDESIPQPIVAEIRETPPAYNHAYISANNNIGHINSCHRKRSITEVSDPSDSYFMPKTNKPCIYSGEVVSVYVDYQNKPHEEGY